METFENHWLVVKIHCLTVTGKLKILKMRKKLFAKSINV